MIIFLIINKKKYIMNKNFKNKNNNQKKKS